MSDTPHRETLAKPMICPSCGTQITTLYADRKDCMVAGMCCVCSFCGQFSQMSAELKLVDVTPEMLDQLPHAMVKQMYKLQRFICTYIHEKNDQGDR